MPHHFTLCTGCLGSDPERCELAEAARRYAQKETAASFGEAECLDVCGPRVTLRVEDHAGHTHWYGIENTDELGRVVATHLDGSSDGAELTIEPPG